MTLTLGSATRRSPLPPLSDLVARVDLYALVERYAGPGRASGSTTLYSCPSPGHEDRNPSFSVFTGKNGALLAKCHSEGWSGDALALVKWLEGCDTAEAARRLRVFLGEPETFSTYSGSISTMSKKPSAPAPRPKAPRPVDTSERPSPEEASRFLACYLEWRAWPEDIAKRFGLEVVLDSHGGLRVRHPYLVATGSGEWVLGWWQDRGGAKSTRKWLAPKGSEVVLHNLPSLESDTLDAVVVCEGPADTITAALVLEDLRESVAVVGVPGAGNWKPEWASLFSGLRVVIAADNDEAGRRLEQAVSASLDGGAVVIRPASGDLSTLYAEQGYAALRTLLLSGLGDLAPAPLPEVLLVISPEEVAP